MNISNGSFMMRKHLYLGICVLALTACGTGRVGQKNATLADMFVWGQNDNTNADVEATPVHTTMVAVSEKNKYAGRTGKKNATLMDIFSKEQNDTPQTIEVKHIEQPVYDAPYAPEDDGVEVKYVEVQPNQPVVSEGRIVASDYDGYSLAKRGERYESAEYNVTPQVYGIVASRAVNKMLADAPAIFANNKNAPLFIEDTVYVDRYMPVSPDVAGKTAKEILHGSKMFNITDDREKAQYILKGMLNNVNTPEIPVFFYELKLYDNAGTLQGKWSDTIRQVQNDDGSWW